VTAQTDIIWEHLPTFLHTDDEAAAQSAFAHLINTVDGIETYGILAIACATIGGAAIRKASVELEALRANGVDVFYGAQIPVDATPSQRLVFQMITAAANEDRDTLFALTRTGAEDNDQRRSAELLTVLLIATKHMHATICDGNEDGTTTP
jgi:hypothetical protein